MASSRILSHIDRYMLYQLLMALVCVTAGLVALIWLTQSLRFIHFIVDRGLSPMVFIKLTLLLVPSFVATILPITCFIVVLFVYGRLAGDRELTVMRAAGMSDVALARPAVAVGAITMLVCYLLNLVLVPDSVSAFRTYEFEIRNEIAAFLLEPGVFTQISTNVTVYVQSRSSDDQLSGILIEDARQSGPPATVLARSGQLMVTPQGPILELIHGSREQVDPKTGRLNMLTFQRNVVNLATAQQPNYLNLADPAGASFGQLYHPLPWMTQAQRAKWLVEAHRRLTAPLTAIGFTVIGLYATLGGRFRRHGGMSRLFLAVAAVTLLVALGLGINNFAAKHLALLPLIWIVACAPGAVAAALLFLPRRSYRYAASRIFSLVGP
jgi:lipopolysaccharide export system permease protein